ncbi:Metalloprotease [Desarmillaria tabescens]|uniref:deuterolysin n=1 Tax=Armillaria tabescens TaxID=1929756 RepID=A0AA39JA98_ARMTA|nr:Metalloprotease [Desarmillaria tabescens]KAK0439072.1 Metalloprotease [Desarmillaria tabescens]
MLTSLIVLSLTLYGFTSPLKRDASLSVSLSGPASNITSIDDLKFTATVSNTGSESVKILKYGTILDDILPTRSFNVTKDGVAVPFTGIKLSISLEDIDDSAFAFISSGQSVTAEHDLSALFDFASVGAGAFTFSPVTSFQIISPKTRLTSGISLDQCAVDICTDNSKKSFIDARLVQARFISCLKSSKICFSYTEGKTLASIASAYISANGSNSLYTGYYGITPTAEVLTVFDRVANETSNTRTMDCTDPFGVCRGSTVAYTAIATTNVYFCDRFFSEVPQTDLRAGNTTVAARNIRGSTVLHELTHATSDTLDVSYGCANDQRLLATEQVVNADNYECFATQVYYDTKCN